MLQGTYGYWRVVVPSILATLADYAALDLVARVSVTRGRSRLLRLIFGSTAMGMAIGGAHYLGMVAFTLPVPIPYRYPNILCCFVAAILGSVAFLIPISRSRMTIRSGVVGSVLMGGSIAAMHSAALTAIVAPAVISYPWQLHVASFVFGILVSAFALLVGFRERFHAGCMIRKFFTAFILGCGIHLLRPSPTFPAANACWRQPALGFAPKIFSFAPGCHCSVQFSTQSAGDCWSMERLCPSHKLVCRRLILGSPYRTFAPRGGRRFYRTLAARRTGLGTHTCVSRSLLRGRHLEFFTFADTDPRDHRSGDVLS